MRTITKYLVEKTTDFKIGDTILVGKYRNSPTEVTGFSKDDNNQPTVKTKNKGERSLYKFRIQKLMPTKESIAIMKSSSISISKVCPFCSQEVTGDQIALDQEGNIYHRPCLERGPIGKACSKKVIVKNEEPKNELETPEHNHRFFTQDELREKAKQTEKIGSWK